MKGEVKGPREADARCRDCRRYDPERMFCRKDQRNVHPMSQNPGCFEMDLADHYVESPWEKWKRQAEKKAAGLKSKSGM